VKNQNLKMINFRSKSKIIYFIFIFILFGILFFIFNVHKVNAATLYFSPSSGNFTVGDILTTSILVNTQGQAINNTEAIINFPSDLLEVVSVNKSGSIFSLWVEEPAFSNSAGTISFNGGLPTPGFNGTMGKIINIIFRVKGTGLASLIFSSAAVRANDGYGTDILKSPAQAQFNLVPVEVPPTIFPVGAPEAPKVFSSTHPDSEKWYSNNDPKFTWEVPSGITGTRLLVGRLPTAVPTIFYSEAISEKQLEDLADGIWYFHVQLRNKSGWGRISHFKFQIDSTNPLPFEIKVKEGKETTNPQPTLIFETTDEISGIDYYEIKIDLEPSIKIEEVEYKIPVQDLGKHTVIVKAVDRAGNYTLAMTEINILSIEMPIITDYPHELLPGSIFSIKGTALPEVTVRVYIQKDGKVIKMGETKSDKEGKWTYIEVEPVEKGIYQVWTEAIDIFGAKSRPSKKVTVLVSPPVFIRIGKLAIDYLTTIMTLLILILVIIFGIIWSWQKIRQRKRRLKKELDEAEKALYQAFKALKEEVEEQIAALDKKPGLSKSEKELRDKLQEALNISEEFIGKEIKDVEKELE
jgi:5-hydroxyisourate hydrolase-like protein (transthyretin family)